MTTVTVSRPDLEFVLDRIEKYGPRSDAYDRLRAALQQPAAQSAEPVGYGRWADGLPAGTRLLQHDGQPLVRVERDDFCNVPLYALQQPATPEVVVRNYCCCGECGTDGTYDSQPIAWKMKSKGGATIFTEKLERTDIREDGATIFTPLYDHPPIQQPAAPDLSDVHSDDLAVECFAVAMKAKLAKKRSHGYGGWNNKDECSAQRLSRFLVDHIAKGDPVDVANFAMMLHQRGERIELESPNFDEALCEVFGFPQQPTIRQQQSIDDLPGMWDKSDLEGGEADSHADLIRMRLLQHVPPVGEWPEEKIATHWAFNRDGQSYFHGDEPRAWKTQNAHHWASSLYVIGSVIIPEHLRPHWAESLWSREEVLAARGRK